MRAPAFVNNQRNLPSVDTVLHGEGANDLIGRAGRELAVYCIRTTLDAMRAAVDPSGKQHDGGMIPPETILQRSALLADALRTPSLRPVVNATGIILHTNLGRAPLGSRVLADLAPVVNGYTNLEFDLDSAERGHRMSHLTGLLICLTHAQDALVVNNNAAAIILTLHTLAQGREVIVSRGELIEIGGAFRIPEIMAASGARMVEVGTTNRTRISDYEQAITPNTALLFKAHKSNYTISGFTEEVTVAELASLAHAHHLPFVYDIGSGLLRKPKIDGIASEPDVRSALADGADLVCFSGDKLLGGPQTGIIAGKKALVGQLAKAPLMRALRVGKLAIAALSSACRSYLTDAGLLENNPVFHLLERSVATRRDMAQRILDSLRSSGINAEMVSSTVQCGGGTLPELKLPGHAVALLPPQNATVKEREAFADGIFHRLLNHEYPVLGVLREGKLLFDTGALFDDDIERVTQALVKVMAAG